MSQTTLIKFRERVRSERKKKGFSQVKLASGWGDAVVEMIARDLTRELNGAKGFSRRNLYRIKRWYEFYADQNEFVPQAVAQIPWGHNALILEKIKDAPTALWYVRKTIENGWSRNVLGIQIENRLYERQAAAEKLDNFSARLPAASSDLARETLKDPYVFDFLGLGEEAKERDIEAALVERLTRFMLELGKGFAPSSAASTTWRSAARTSPSTCSSTTSSSTATWRSS